jgi:hypothetical protein
LAYGLLELIQMTMHIILLNISLCDAMWM